MPRLPMFLMIGCTGAATITVVTPDNLNIIVSFCAAVWAAYVLHLAIEDSLRYFAGKSPTVSELAKKLAPAVIAVICVICATCCWEMRFHDESLLVALRHCLLEIVEVSIVLTFIRYFPTNNMGRKRT